jgi:serine phosphatase RsbU (regulator of sigma subunit)/pSer/pThr/pTyr-binding forkhead associated (FHA) protein
VFSITIQRPGEAPRKINLDRPVTTVGRSSMNDVALPDKSLSRRHLRIVREGNHFTVEDLGSRNGSFVNGERLLNPRRLLEGDRVALGVYTLVFNQEATTHVEIDSTNVMNPLDATVFRAEASILRDQTRRSDPSLPAASLARLMDSMRVVNEMTMELLRDQPIDEMLDLLMDRVFDSLKPDRAAILLKKGDQLQTARAKVGLGKGDEEIRISQTLVSAVVEKRQGLLLVDTAESGPISTSHSIRMSGVKTVLAAPLENNNEVVGLIYVDSRVGARSFSEDDLRFLTLLANVAAAKIQSSRLEAEAAEKKRMERDFSLAREIQQKLVPEEPPEVPGWELLGSNLPSKEVSGDYYDFRLRPDGKLYAVIADVCGKGVGPALLMAWLEATFTAWADEGMALTDLVTRLSTSLSARTASDRFVTAFFGLLDGKTGEVEYVNAGHNPPLLLRRGGQIEMLAPHGMPLAVFPKPYPSSRTVMEPGDLLFLYTDGVTEATNAAEEEFGMDRLRAFALRHREAKLEEIEAALIKELETFAENRSFADDRTWVLLRRK